MKTRIKVVEYADGNKKYLPQVKWSFKEQIISMFDSEPFWFVVLFFLSILFALLNSLFWYSISHRILKNDLEFEYFAEVTESEFIDNAKKAIDNLILDYKKEKNKKESLRLSEKIVKTTHIKYP